VADMQRAWREPFHPGSIDIINYWPIRTGNVAVQVLRVSARANDESIASQVKGLFGNTSISDSSVLSLISLLLDAGWSITPAHRNCIRQCHLFYGRMARGSVIPSPTQ
jgi:hypothetical protein